MHSLNAWGRDLDMPHLNVSDFVDFSLSPYPLVGVDGGELRGVPGRSGGGVVGENCGLSVK